MRCLKTLLLLRPFLSPLFRASLWLRLFICCYLQWFLHPFLTLFFKAKRLFGSASLFALIFNLKVTIFLKRSLMVIPLLLKAIYLDSPLYLLSSITQKLTIHSWTVNQYTVILHPFLTLFFKGKHCLARLLISSHLLPKNDYIFSTHLI